MVSCKKHFRGWWDLLSASLPLWQRRACRSNDGESFAMPQFLREQDAPISRLFPKTARPERRIWRGTSHEGDPCQQGEWAGSRLVCGGDGGKGAGSPPVFLL